MSALDKQVGGEHYREGGIQPVQYIEANGLGFLEGCVVKRLTRHNRPTGKGRQDIEKAIHELQLLLELRYGVTVTNGESAPSVTLPPCPEGEGWSVPGEVLVSPKNIFVDTQQPDGRVTRRVWAENVWFPGVLRWRISPT